MKKLMTFLLTLVLFFTLVSCGKDDESSGNTYPVYELLGGQTLTLYVGQTGNFEEGYTYSTTDTDVISINGTTFTTLKAGSASITVTKDENKLGVIIVAVYGRKDVALNDLVLVNKPDYLTIANVIKLEYQKDPIDATNYEAIVWSSSDSSIATVDKDGYVTPLKMGEVTITLTAVNTNVKKEYTFTVFPRETIFELNYDEIVGVCDTVEKVLVPDILTDYEFDGNVTWFSENEEVVQVSQDGTTTFCDPGTTYVGIKGVIDNKEITYKCKVTVLDDEGYTIIRTPIELQEIANTSGYYMLGNDIDMAQACSEGGDLYNNGNGFMPLFDSAENAFVGVFDGNGFSIKNMYINRPNDVYVAFMRYISAVEGKEGLIKNLSFEGGEIKGGNYTAVFYSKCHGYGSKDAGLRDAYVNMKVSSVGSMSCLVGDNEGYVENCVVQVEIDALGKVCLFGLNTTGLEEGLGFNNCYFIGNAQGAELAKIQNTATMTNCHALTEAQASTFEFNLGNNWSWTKGSLPVLKGVAHE